MSLQHRAEIFEIYAPPSDTVMISSDHQVLSLEEPIGFSPKRHVYGPRIEELIICLLHPMVEGARVEIITIIGVARSFKKLK